MLAEYSRGAIETYLPTGEVLVKRIDMHCTVGNSDKVYIIATSKRNNNEHVVRGLYGRRGASLQVQEHGVFANFQAAGTKETQIIQDKTKPTKGYVTKGTESYSSGGTMARNANKNAAPHTILGNAIEELHPGDVVGESSKDAVIDILKSENVVLEPYQEIDTKQAFYYVSFEVHPSGSGWFAYDDTKRYAFHESEAPGNINAGRSQHGTVLLAYKTKSNRLAIFDMLKHAHKFIGDLPWKVRRTMLTTWFEELFPNRDPYDTTFYSHLHDYIYRDKVGHVKKNRGMYIARHIERDYTDESVIINI